MLFNNLYNMTWCHSE